MGKILLIITRATNNEEFKKFWKFSECKPQCFNSEKFNLIILNGYDYCNSDYQYEHDKILAVLNTQMKDAAKIGILYHNTDWPELENYFQVNVASDLLIFCNSYGTRDEPFFDIEKDVNVSEKPMNILRDGIVELPNSKKFIEGFNAVWNYKGGDGLLDAKLELLHALVGANEKEFDAIWKRANDICSLKTFEADWKKYKKDKDFEKLSSALSA